LGADYLHDELESEADLGTDYFHDELKRVADLMTLLDCGHVLAPLRISRPRPRPSLDLLVAATSTKAEAEAPQLIRVIGIRARHYSLNFDSKPRARIQAAVAEAEVQAESLIGLSTSMVLKAAHFSLLWVGCLGRVRR
jgi:hypothetical protein